PDSSPQSLSLILAPGSSSQSRAGAATSSAGPARRVSRPEASWLALRDRVPAPVGFQLGLWPLEADWLFSSFRSHHAWKGAGVTPYHQLAGLLVGRPPAVPLEEAEWEGLVWLAQKQGVAPLLASNLRSLPVDVPARVGESLAAIYRNAVHLSLMYE